MEIHLAIPEEVVRQHVESMASDLLTASLGVWTDAEGVATHFGVSARTVWVWKDEKGLPYRQVDTVVRFNLVECTKWINKQKGRDFATPALKTNRKQELGGPKPARRPKAA